jgi:hypothetical protein
VAYCGTRVHQRVLVRLIPFFTSSLFGHFRLKLIEILLCACIGAVLSSRTERTSEPTPTALLPTAPSGGMLKNVTLLNAVRLVASTFSVRLTPSAFV